MVFLFNILSIGVIGGADGPTAVMTSGDLPLPAITVAAVAIAFILYVYITKAVRRKNVPAEAVAAEAPAKPAGVPMPAGMTQGELELVNTDEKTAAVIMAIVSDKSGIPLNRLAFKSIKLMEDNK